MAYVNKWLTFSASVLCQLGAGLTYTFSLYSNDLKERFGYTQQQIEGLGSACNFGGFFAVISGLLYDYLGEWHHMGPRLVLLVGAALNLGGYSLLWFGATSTSFQPAYWQVVVAGMLACNGGSWTDMAALVTNVRNWPSHRGTVVGILKSCVGLSASVFTSMYVGFLQPDALDYLLYLAITPALLNILCLPFFNFVPYEQEGEREPRPGHLGTDGRFTIAAQILFVLAIYQVTTALVAKSPRLALSKEMLLGLTVGTIILVSTILFLPIGTGGLWATPDQASPQSDEERPSTPATPEIQERLLPEAPPSSSSPISALDQEPDGVPAGDNLLQLPLLEKLQRTVSADSREGGIGLGSLSPWECLCSLNFWLLWCVCCIGLGSGLVFLNNLGQLVLALGGSGSPAVLVSLFSVMNCGGRIFFGYVPERCLREFKTPRPAFLVGIAALSAFINVANACAPLPLLFVSALLAGFSFGGHWSLMSAITSEVFGLRFFASNYALIQLAPAAGGLLMATKLVGWLYDREVARQGAGPVCLGPHCYRLAFLLCALLSMLATAAATLFAYLTVHVYHVEEDSAARPATERRPGHVGHMGPLQDDVAAPHSPARSLMEASPARSG